MDYETIVSVLIEKIKNLETTIFVNAYKIEDLQKKIDTYEAQIETQMQEAKQ